MNKFLSFCIMLLLLFAYQIIIFGQSGQLTGFVYNNNGQAVEGANITLIGTNYGTTSDSKGSFVLEKIPFGSYTMEISFVGFKKERKNIILNNSLLPIRIILNPVPVETEQVIVSAGKYKQKISDVTVSTAVMEQDIISQKNILQLDEALRYIPGVNVNLNQVSIRGSSGYSRGAGTRVLVAVDGIPVYTGISGEIVWQLIPLSDIQKVEIIKGPASSLYGQSAIGGVINIITRDIPEKPITYVKTSGGLYYNPSFDEWRWTSSLRTFYGLEVAHSDRIGKLGYTISLKRLDNESYRKNDYNKYYSGYLKLNYDIDVNNSIKFMTYYVNTDQGYFPFWKNSRNALIPNEGNLQSNSKSNREFFSLIYHHNFSQSFSGDIKSSYYRSNLTSYQNQETLFASDLLRNEFIGTLRVNNNWTIISGAEFAYSFINSSIFANPHYLTASFYIQSGYKISERINSIIGFRNDYIKLTGVTDADVITPKAGLNYKFSDNLIFRTSISTGFRSPTPAEAYIAADGRGNLTMVGNPSLNYETSVSYEFGAIFEPANWLKFDASVFNTDYKNFIEPILTNEESVKFVNLPKAKIQGFELVANLNTGTGLPEISFGYDYLWARDLTKNQFLKYRPRHTIYSSITLNSYPFEYRTDIRYWSKIEEIDFNLTDPPINLIPDGRDRSDAFVVDLSVGYNFTVDSKPVKFIISGKNIFNYNYIEFIGNLAPIRNISMSLEGYF